MWVLQLLTVCYNFTGCWLWECLRYPITEYAPRGLLHACHLQAPAKGQHYFDTTLVQPKWHGSGQLAQLRHHMHRILQVEPCQTLQGDLSQACGCGMQAATLMDIAPTAAAIVISMLEVNTSHGPGGRSKIKCPTPEPNSANDHLEHSTAVRSKK